APGAAYLRALPGGRGFEAFAIAIASAAVHLPWAAVWWFGGGVATGGLAWLTMTAGSLALVLALSRFARAPRPPRWRGPIGLAAIGVAWGLGAVGAAIAARRGDPPRIDGTRVAVSMLGLAAAGLVLIGLFGLPGLAGAAALGAGLALPPRRRA